MQFQTIKIDKTTTASIDVDPQAKVPGPVIRI